MAQVIPSQQCCQHYLCDLQVDGVFLLWLLVSVQWQKFVIFHILFLCLIQMKTELIHFSYFDLFLFCLFVCLLFFYLFCDYLSFNGILKVADIVHDVNTI